MAKIAILGAGVMGSSMSVPASAAGHDIALIGTPLDEVIIKSIQSSLSHPSLSVKLPSEIKAYQFTELSNVLAQKKDLLILGVSSGGVDWATSQLIEHLDGTIPILMITKGLVDNGQEIETLPTSLQRNIKKSRGLELDVMAIGGPCIAGELAAKRSTMVTFTGKDIQAIENIAKMLECEFYHVRISSDLIGVELCAAFKNFYALGVGWAHGFFEASGDLSDGPKMHNLASSIFNQAIHEMNILVKNLGGMSESVYGLPGVGDLYVTCLAGRNSRMGHLLGLGNTYSYAKNHIMENDTVEGAELAKALAPALKRYWDSGKLPKASMPLARSIVNSICDDLPLKMNWWEFSR